MIHRFWHFVIAAMLAAFLLAFYANNRPATAGVCRGVAELMAYIEARETDEVQFDFMDSAERAAFAARTKMNDANSVEVLTARKADPTATVLVADGPRRLRHQRAVFQATSSSCPAPRHERRRAGLHDLRDRDRGG